MMRTIRPMVTKDKAEVMDMMRVFYASPAVITNGSEEIFSNNVDRCVSDDPYADGYVITQRDEIQGYAMVAKSYSTEFGKTCIWIEDLYIKEPFRGQGLGKQLLEHLINAYTDCIFRLEVEQENIRAVGLYKQLGFAALPYMEMKK